MMEIVSGLDLTMYSHIQLKISSDTDRHTPQVLIVDVSVERFVSKTQTWCMIEFLK